MCNMRVSIFTQVISIFTYRYFIVIEAIQNYPKLLTNSENGGRGCLPKMMNTLHNLDQEKR